MHHEITDGHFIHLRSVFDFILKSSASDSLTNQIEENRISRIDLKSYEHNLGFVIGLNKSDFTYGWYGNMHGLHMYYNYFTDQGTF